MARTKKTTAGEEANVSIGQVSGALVMLIQIAPAIMYLILKVPAISDDHVTLFVSGLVLLAMATYAFFFVLWRTMKLRSVAGLIFTFITFTAYIDTCISLCLTTPNFNLGRFYLDKGEKYFQSTYGFICLFWDGTFHVVIQFTLAVLALTKREYHFTALVWAGSVINSMAPLLFGAATGPYSNEIQLSTALNGPYIFLPVAVIIYLLTKTPAIHRKEGAGSRVRSHHLLSDVALILYNFLVPVAHIVRVMCILGSEAKIVQWWLKVEPVFDRTLLADRNDRQDFAFMAVQAVQWAFWFVPWHWAALYEQVERIRTGKRTVVLGDRGVDFSAIVFGGYLQSLACLFVTSYFDMADGVVGLSARKVNLGMEFWLINVATLVCSALHFVHFHVQDIEDTKQD